MTDPRKPVFDAIRKQQPIKSSDVPIVDKALDDIGFPRAGPAAPSNLMRTSPKGIKLIHDFESCRLKAYPDPGTGGKPWTIGWGSTTDEQGNPIQPGTVWSQERADARFAQDLIKFEAGVRATIGDTPTTQNQFDAMVSFHYNTGAIGTSTLGKKHKARDYAGAAAEFARWNKAGGKVMAGLTRRRAAEAALYRS